MEPIRRKPKNTRRIRKKIEGLHQALSLIDQHMTDQQNKDVVVGHISREIKKWEGYL